MGKFDVDMTEVKKLVELVDANELAELTVEDGDTTISIKGRAPAVAAAPVVAHAPVGHEQYEEQAPVAAEPEPVIEDDGSVVDIVAPLVGVFYRSPSPDQPPFVEIGDEVEVGAEVGLIEAMKVFSPIPSEIAGIVVATVAQSGQLVHQGDVLIKIRVNQEKP